jgi:hypothetical protein
MEQIENKPIYDIPTLKNEIDDEELLVDFMKMPERQRQVAYILVTRPQISNKEIQELFGTTPQYTSILKNKPKVKTFVIKYQLAKFRTIPEIVKINYVKALSVLGKNMESEDEKIAQDAAEESIKEYNKFYIAGTDLSKIKKSTPQPVPKEIVLDKEVKTAGL